MYEIWVFYDKPLAKFSSRGIWVRLRYEFGMALNLNLRAAKTAAEDEFYTQLSDINAEVKHYRDHFKNKVAYCNCDDPRVSNFFRHFFQKFQHYGLKQLITTCYKNQQPDRFSEGNSKRAVYLEYNGDRDRNYPPDPRGVIPIPLHGNGDFRSSECIELLNQADIVVTNPPFSLFRKYVAQLMEHDKKFLIVGNQNAISYKEIFPLIKENKIWLGIEPGGKDMLFDVTEKHAKFLVENKKEGSAYRIVDGIVKGRLGNACWFTNLPHKKRNEEFYALDRYFPDKYPKYDNYDAIEVSEVDKIPRYYDGAMGVPVTFLSKYNPEQFEILGMDRPLLNELTGKQSRFWLNGKEIYARIVIRYRK